MLLISLLNDKEKTEGLILEPHCEHLSQAWPCVYGMPQRTALISIGKSISIFVISKSISISDLRIEQEAH